jgi:hypothetical protein
VPYPGESELVVFSECIEVTDSQPLRQGDVFEWLDDSDNPYQQSGVIVTADCDIAQAKHTGILSYAPILRLKDYLRLFFLPRRLDRIVTSLSAELNALIRKLQMTYRPDFPEPLSDEAIEVLMRSSEPQEVAEILGVPAGKDNDRLLRVVEVVQACLIAQDDASFESQFDAVIRARELRSSSKQPARDALWSDIHGHVKTLPGDAFFIGAITDERRDGYVAYLRLVREIRSDEIAIRQTDLRSKGVRARRIAHLCSPYVYRLTQQLGGR